MKTKAKTIMGMDPSAIEAMREKRSEAAEQAVEAGILPDPNKVNEMPQQKQRYEIVKSKRITGLSFVLDRETGEWMITVGTRVVSEKKFKSLKKAQRYEKKNPWDMIVTICAAVSIMATTAERIFNNNQGEV